MIEIGVILGSYQLTRVLAELTGIIESIGVKVDRLSASELQAGIRALAQAERSSGERISLLREARARLNKAITLEKENQLAAAYIALAATHHQLGDTRNTHHVLREFLAVDFVPPLAKAVGKAAGVDDGRVVIPVAVAALIFPFHVLRNVGLLVAAYGIKQATRIDELKRAVRAYLGEAEAQAQNPTEGSTQPPAG